MDKIAEEMARTDCPHSSDTKTRFRSSYFLSVNVFTIAMKFVVKKLIYNKMN